MTELQKLTEARDTTAATAYAAWREFALMYNISTRRVTERTFYETEHIQDAASAAEYALEQYLAKHVGEPK